MRLFAIYHPVLREIPRKTGLFLCFHGFFRLFSFSGLFWTLHVFQHPLSSFPIPLHAAPKAAHSHDAAQNAVGQNLAHEIVGTVQPVRSPQEWGGLWKRERERKPLGGERISIVRCALSPPKEVVARTPVDGSCVTHPVK